MTATELQKQLAESTGAALDAIGEYRTRIYKANGYGESPITKRIDAVCDELRKLRVELPAFDHA